MDNLGRFKKGNIPYYKGKIMPPEVCKKLSISHKGQRSHRRGKTLEEEYGVERAKEIQIKLSKSHTGKFLDKSSNWQGGLTFEKYPWEFTKHLRRGISERDKICKLCGISEEEYGRKLDSHHIDYDKNNNDEFNLVSLCRRCHGRTNNNRSFWKYVFNLMMHYWYVDVGKIGA